jgi:hypothetical protein
MAFMGLSADVLSTDTLQLRFQQHLKEMLMIHRCVNCYREYTPIQSMGMRECSLHPMNLQDGSVSATEFINYRGSSRIYPRHYKCCGSFKKTLMDFDPHHQFYNSYDACTPADHVSNNQWQQLVGSAALEYQALFNNFNQPAALEVIQWLRVYPLEFLLFLAAIKWPDERHTLTTGNAIKRLLGSSSIIVDQVEQVISPTDSRRRLMIPAGTRRFFIDAKDAYLHMTRYFGLPSEIVGSADVQTMVIQQRQQFEAGTFASQSSLHSLDKAMTLLGSSRRANGVLSTRGIDTSLPIQHANKSSAFQILRTTLAMGNKLEQEKQTKRDLYSLDADTLLKDTRYNKMANISVSNIHSANLEDLSQQLVSQFLPVFKQENDAFIPFVVGSWVDPTPYRNEFEMRANVSTHDDLDPRELITVL